MSKLIKRRMKLGEKKQSIQEKAENEEKESKIKIKPSIK